MKTVPALGVTMEGKGRYQQVPCHRRYPAVGKQQSAHGDLQVFIKGPLHCYNFPHCSHLTHQSFLQASEGRVWLVDGAFKALGFYQLIKLFGSLEKKNVLVGDAKIEFLFPPKIVPVSRSQGSRGTEWGM